MVLQRETREEWGARPPKHRRYDVNPLGVAVHYPGADTAIRAMDHDQHRALLRQWQAQHMARDSNDIEYGSLICPCGIWMEGRTEFDNPMVRVGSNGNAAANRDYTSVQLMLGNRESITEQEVQWLGEAIAWLRGEGWGPKIVGHRDLSSTACPGNSIYQALPRIRAAAANPQGADMTPEESQRLANMDHLLHNSILPAIEALQRRTEVVFFHAAPHIYEADVLSGTYRRIGNPDTLRDRQHVLSKQGIPFSVWNGGSDVANPAAFGVEVGEPQES